MVGPWSESTLRDIGPGSYEVGAEDAKWKDPHPELASQDRGFGWASRGLVDSPRGCRTGWLQPMKQRKLQLSVFASNHLKRSYRVPTLPREKGNGMDKLPYW
eukprot:TRINITY_DN7903_c0_g3_i1.p3 TRINITY_DN7903_c0_g3~~TRINITY_DN7903_c0_g3_i1.p3  ORF type:complete len:102 (-),score=13.00 TRINITY_DN7903_c0_g3_i1:225-530(-)